MILDTHRPKSLIAWCSDYKLSRHTADLYVKGGLVYARTGTKRKKVAIVGFTDKVRKQAPYNDPEWEVWAFNMANRMDFMKDDQGLLRADRWFDLHELHAQSQADMAWITTCPVPLYLTEPFTKNKNAVVYPLDAVQQTFRKYGTTGYFASSFAYAMALAMHEGFETIGLFGCDLDWGRERVVEHGNLAYWVGLAQGLGHKVLIPQNSRFLTHPGFYGFEYNKESQAVEDRMVRLIFELFKNESIAKKYDALATRWRKGDPTVERELWGHLLPTEDAPIQVD